MAKLCRCGGVASDKKIKMERTVGGRRIVFTNVPVSVCPNCNEQYISAKVLKKMDRLLGKHEKAIEINFESDPKDEYFVGVLKIAHEHKFIHNKEMVDMPTSITDVIFAIDKLKKLREEQCAPR